MSNQTSVESTIRNATAGLLADIHLGHHVISAAAESDIIPFGIVVQRGSSPDTLVKNGGSELGILGVSVRELGREAATVNAESAAYSKHESVSILQDGYIFAVCVDGCIAGDKVKFDNDTGALSSGDAINGETEVVTWEWMESVSPNTVAKLYVRSAHSSDLQKGSGSSSDPVILNNPDLQKGSGSSSDPVIIESTDLQEGSGSEEDPATLDSSI